MENFSMNSELSSFLSVMLGLAIACCISCNLWVFWICRKNRNDNELNFNFSPFFINSCIVDTMLTCIYGPILCVMFNNKTLKFENDILATLDVIFLALFWCITITHLIYSLDRHCLLTARNLYPDSFGRVRRNAVTLLIVWITAITVATVYFHIRQISEQNISPMTFTFAGNILYCIISIIMLHVSPTLIIIGCLFKIFNKIRRKPVPLDCVYEANAEVRLKMHGLLTKDVESCYGLLISSVLFILSSTPWVIFQLLKALKLNRNDLTEHEIILLSILVTGVGMKTASYVLSSKSLRQKFFSILLRNYSGEFTLQQPAVIQNMNAM